MAVTLYRQVGKGKSRRYQKVNLGRGRRPADLTGPYFLRYSLADGTRPWEHVGDDLDEAIAARERRNMRTAAVWRCMHEKLRTSSREISASLRSPVLVFGPLVSELPVTRTLFARSI